MSVIDGTTFKAASDVEIQQAAPVLPWMQSRFSEPGFFVHIMLMIWTKNPDAARRKIYRRGVASSTVTTRISSKCSPSIT
jgi:hypothetical protein